MMLFDRSTQPSMSRGFFYLPLSVLLLVIACLTGVGAARGDVLASVDDATLTWEELLSLIGGTENVDYLGIRNTADAHEILMSWVREELIVRAAERDNIAADPYVAEALEQVRRQVLLEAYLAMAVEDVQVSQLEVENYLADWADSYGRELHLEHILVGSQEVVLSIKARLVAGGSFGQLAEQYSICPSGEDGGDLGWLRRGDADLRFEEAAYRLEPGRISDIVETSMGYHLIRLVDSREIASPPSEEDIASLAYAELLQFKQQQRLNEIVGELQALHEVTLHEDRLLEHVQ